MILLSVFMFLPFSCTDNSNAVSPNSNSNDTNSSQASEFVSVWKVDDGAGNTFFIVLHANGTAQKTIDTTATGTWTSTADCAQIAWNDGWIDVIAKDSTGYKKIAYSPGTPLTGTPNNTTVALKTTIPQTLDFSGIWKVGDGQGNNFYITLFSNNIAEKTNGTLRTGTWVALNVEAEISWDDGWKDAIVLEGTAYKKKAFSPGTTFTDTPNNITDAIKLALVP